MRPILLTFLLCISSACALDASLVMETASASGRAVGYLLERQGEDGGWVEHPGITAAVVFSLAKSPQAEQETVARAIGRGAAYIRKHARDDGSIGNEQTRGNDVYATSMCLMALGMVGGQEDLPIIRRGRAWLMKQQKRQDFSYAPGYAKATYPDLSNTHWAVEAVRVTTPLVEKPRTERLTAFLAEAARLARDCQVPSGGLTYYPVRRRDPERHPDLPTDRVWGSLTLGGLKTLLYAGVEPDNPARQRAQAWLGKHYTLQRNPGLDDGGYYYYIYMFATTYAQVGDHIRVDGRAPKWRKDVVTTLLAKQGGRGQWQNDNQLWLEQHPELATAYALLALSFASQDQ